MSIAAVTWVVLVSSAYYAVHKPASPAQFRALSGAVGSLVGMLATMGLATVLGLPWTRVLRSEEGSSRIALQLGAGMAGLSYLLLAMGALGAYHRSAAWVLAAMSLPLALPRWIRALRGRKVGWPSGRVDRWLAVFVLGLIPLSAASALAPPTAWDSLVYHLTGPKLYLGAGRLTHDLDLPYLGFPQAGSMLFLWGMLLSGDRLPALIHLAFGLFTLALLPPVVGRIAPGRSWLAAAIMLGVPSAQMLLGQAYVEWMTAFAGLACFLLLTTGEAVGARSQSADANGPSSPAGSAPMGPPPIGRIVLAGMFAALALNTKYSAIWMVAGLGIVAFTRRRSGRDAALFAASVSIFVAPFLLKNWLLTSNPVYPFFFSGKFWDAYRADWFSRPGTGLGAGQLLLAPWEATIWGLEGGFYEGHPSYGATVGPFLLGLIPLSLVGLRSGSREQITIKAALGVLCGTAYLGWVGQLAFSKLLVQTRLLFPVLPELAILAAAGFHGLATLGRHGRSARYIIGGLVSFALALTAVQAAIEFVGNSTIQVATGSESEKQYLARRLGQYALAVEAINGLPDGSRVRFLWEPRSYYCRPGIYCEPDAILDRWWHERRVGGGIPALISAWREGGVTHVLYFRLGAEAVRNSGFDPLVDQDWAELEQFLSEYLESGVSFGDAYFLYQVP